MANIIDGKLVAKSVLEDLSKKVEVSAKKTGLAVIIVGEDPASKIYVNLKRKKALELGFESLVVEMPESTTQEELLNKIDELNVDENINAILVQMPLPKHIDSKVVIERINPKKDVDCFHPYNVGKIASNSDPYVFPCTPKGIMKLLEYYNVEIAGKNAVVVGRSNIVGRPMSQMLLTADATVTVCHSCTQNLSEITKTADILICAVGKSKLIKKDMVKEGAVVIDVGMNRDENGKLCGDVDFDGVSEVASFITPVPGGVGPMTICSLMVNAYELSQM